MADKRKADSEDPRDDTKFRKMNTAEESGILQLVNNDDDESITL